LLPRNLLLAVVEAVAVVVGQHALVVVVAEQESMSDRQSAALLQELAALLVVLAALWKAELLTLEDRGAAGLVAAVAESAVADTPAASVAGNHQQQWPFVPHWKQHHQGILPLPVARNHCISQPYSHSKDICISHQPVVQIDSAIEKQGHQLLRHPA
jgi:hypothetical protein